MAKYVCEVCDFIFDEEKEGTRWEDLPGDWVCPVCDSPKKYYHRVDAVPVTGPMAAVESETVPDGYLRASDEVENWMADIHQMAAGGESIIEPMRTADAHFSWDQVLIQGAQLARIPLNHEDPVNLKTVIGPGARQPLVIDTPIFVTHMSFGALSAEAKTALALGSAAVGTAVCSGEGGILPGEFDAAYRYIFEYVANKYSVSDENLRKVDAIEIKIGQSAKPGMGGHLPGRKVTDEIAAIRGKKPGEDIISPAHFPEITTAAELRATVEMLREKSGGRPVGVKIAAGNIEADMEVILEAEPDFITIDGRAGATGAAPKFVKAASSVPTIFALYRARTFLDEHGADQISLIITGGLRISPDFAKALALGADAVALGTSALIACGCQQYRVCNTGKCPMGITTQDPELRRRFDVRKASRQLENFLRVSSEELRNFARMTGKDDIHLLDTGDLCTVSSEISGHTSIAHV
jgi:methylamine---glutamate N-methyltransferase subunit C